MTRPGSRASHALALGAAAALVATACSRSPEHGGAPGTTLDEPAGYLGPTLVLESPARGATLAGEAGPVALHGRACDHVHALVSVTVAGQAVPVPVSAGPGCVDFEVSMQAAVGVDVVRGEVVNDADERGTLAQAFLLAPAYADLASDGGVPSGVFLRLGPQLFDDGDRTTLDDVASVVEAVVRGRDLDAVVGDLRFASPDSDGDGRIDAVAHDCVLWTERNHRTGFEAWKEGPLTHGGIHVDSLRLEDGGLGAYLSVRDVRVPFGVMGNVDSGCLGDAQKTVHGQVKVASIAVEVHATVGLDATGHPSVQATSTAATLTGLDIDIDLGVLVDWTGLGSLIGDAIEARVRGPIQAAIRDGARDAVDGEVERAVSALAVLGGRFPLPAAVGGGAIDVAAPLDRLDFAADGAVLGARVAIRAEEPAALRAGAPGPVRLGPALPGLDALGVDPLAVAVSDDVLEEILHAAWMAGALDVPDVAAIVPLRGLGAEAHLALAPALPPVVAPRDGGGIALAWGDVAFDLSLQSAHGRAHASGWISISVGLTGLAPDATGTGLVPALDPDVDVAVQVTGVDWDHLPTSRLLAEGMVQALVANALPGLASRTLPAVPLPALDLGALGPGLPRLGLEDASSSRAGGYQVVSGAVAALP